MHFNFHFLKYFCPALESKIKGWSVVECFSQNKDELVIGLGQGENECYLRANFLPVISCLAVSDAFKRSKKNTISLFPELIGQRVEGIHLVNFERAFWIQFVSGDRLLFKLHGTRSNLLFYGKGEDLPIRIFRNELKDDKVLLLQSLEKNLVLDHATFTALQGNASQFLPTLGKIPRDWLKAHGYIEADMDEKWRLMQELLDMLDMPWFSIMHDGNEYVLSMLPAEKPLFQTADPTEAANVLFRYRVVVQGFEKEKVSLQKKLEEQLKRTKAYIEKTTTRLVELEDGPSPSQKADVIMANLHLIGPDTETISLFNFYTQQSEVFNFKRGQTPQKLAETLYRKSKNRKREIDQLYQNLADKEQMLALTAGMIADLAEINDHRRLRDFVKTHRLIPKAQEEEEQVPFKRFEVEGFDVLVGKSAKANDEMLRRFAWKEDLWLHAKDVAGSHVLLKYKSGLSFPKTVLERAAELAAYYSKIKNDSLAPVIYTPAKYVRKVKGSADGSVMVDKESVIMVVPRGPQGLS
jgi:predicted ribosome quality control (RQC) complex YloA/Tae2 family protein